MNSGNMSTKYLGDDYVITKIDKISDDVTQLKVDVNGIKHHVDLIQEQITVLKKDNARDFNAMGDCIDAGGSFGVSKGAVLKTGGIIGALMIAIQLLLEIAKIYIIG